MKAVFRRHAVPDGRPVGTGPRPRYRV